MGLGMAVFIFYQLYNNNLLFLLQKFKCLFRQFKTGFGKTVNKKR
jgi:hypothetical protein